MIRSEGRKKPKLHYLYLSFYKMSSPGSSQIIFEYTKQNDESTRNKIEAETSVGHWTHLLSDRDCGISSLIADRTYQPQPCWDLFCLVSSIRYQTFEYLYLKKNCLQSHSTCIMFSLTTQLSDCYLLLDPHWQCFCITVYS